MEDDLEQGLSRLRSSSLEMAEIMSAEALKDVFDIDKIRGEIIDKIVSSSDNEDAKVVSVSIVDALCNSIKELVKKELVKKAKLNNEADSSNVFSDLKKALEALDSQRRTLSVGSSNTGGSPVSFKTDVSLGAESAPVVSTNSPKEGQQISGPSRKTW
jgi:hypothetical protein